MEEEMRLKVAESVVDIPGPRLHLHNVGQGDRNRNQQEQLADSTGLHSSQWASNYVTSSNATSLLKDHLTINGSNFNNNITATLQQQHQQQQQRVHRTSYSASSDLLSESSPDDSLGDYDVDAQASSSSLDVSPQGDEYRCFSHDELSDSDLSDDGNCHSDLHPCVSSRGIVNPNYPGFQHLAHQLHHSDADADAEADAADDEDAVGEPDNNAYNNNILFNNNNNGNEELGDVEGDDGVGSKIDGINHLDSVENFQKAFYDKPKFNIPVETRDELVCDVQISTVLDLVNDFNVEISDAIDGSVRVGEEHIETLFVEETVESFEPTVVEVVELEATPAEAPVADASRDAVFSEIRKYIIETVLVEDETLREEIVGETHADSACQIATPEEIEQDLTELVAEDSIDTVFSEIRKYVETVHLDDEVEERVDSFVASKETYPVRENVVAEETIETVFSEIRKYVETVFLEDDEPESIEADVELKENNSSSARELTDAEDIETAFSDVELNESLFADLENIKTAFADDGTNDHKTADKFGLTLSSGCGSFADAEVKSFTSRREKQQEKRTAKPLCAPAMATTMMSLPGEAPQQIASAKLEDAFLSNSKEEPPRVVENIKCDQLLKPVEKKDMCLVESQKHGDSNRADDEREKFIKEEQLANEKEKDEDSVVPRKKEKMEINYSVKKSRQCTGGGKGVTDLSLPLSTTNSGVVRRREFGPRSRDYMMANRRSMPAAREKKRASPDGLGSFDVYNIETAMPKIDLDAIESHLKAAREEDRRRRNDREEIRKRLAMGSDVDEYYGGDRPGRKPSLQARLQSGMNLQICFMNETVSDTESPNSDTEPSTSPTKLRMEKPIAPYNYALPLKSPAGAPPRTRPSPSALTLPLRRETEQAQPMTEADFFARQARLQAEARMALAQAKEMAHMQMEIERQRQKQSPITEMVRSSLEKVGIPFPEDRRRVSRQILTEMNLAQLQVIVNDLHTQIEVLNENLVKFLMNRDDLHMEQDSMLVDIEDLTRYLGAKEQPAKEPKDQPSMPTSNSLLLLTNKPKQNRIAGLVKK